MMVGFSLGGYGCPFAFLREGGNMTTESLMSTYARLPVTFERGEGAWLWDDNGKQYLDAVSGIAVCSLGHAHPAVTEAISRQAHNLLHTSNLYQIAPQERLGEKLCQLSGLDKVFFSNSGAEANEAAIKLARLYGHQQGIGHPQIIVMEHSFHGRTLATLSATGNPKIQEGFAPLVEGFLRVNYNDIAAVQTLAEQHHNIVAILVEPIQGEGGVNVPDQGYLTALRKLCNQHHWLLMLDEIQTGMGRTGKWFAFQHENDKPDVMTLAKALANGVPIGACLAGNKASKIFTPGSHGSTFGGNPLSCQAALAVIDTMETERLPERAAEFGAKIVTQFQQAFAEEPKVKEVRGQGLIIGIELTENCTELVKIALDDGLLINVTAGNVIRLLPPLILNHKQLTLLTTKIINLVRDFIHR